MTDVKDALGRTLSRRRLLGMGALAGMGVAGFSACGGGSSGGPGGGSWWRWRWWPGAARLPGRHGRTRGRRCASRSTRPTTRSGPAPRPPTRRSSGTTPPSCSPSCKAVRRRTPSTSATPGWPSSRSPTTSSNSRSSSVPRTGKKASETFPGLVEWTKSADGGIYGVCVDCNPMVFWFNKGLLAGGRRHDRPGGGLRGWHLDTGRAGRPVDQGQDHRQARLRPHGVLR